jgi:hypothetical protein
VDVSDYYELLALLRAVMEAKFGESSNDTEIVASPHLANVANRIVDSLITIEKQRGDYLESKWQVWRRIDSTRREWKLMRKRLRIVEQWKTWSIEERGRFLDYLLSPLTLADVDRQKLLRK